MANDRQDLVRIITENREQFASAEHIAALFAVTVEDLTAGGVEQRRVMAAMMYAWTRIVSDQIGLPKTVETLRDMADAIERHGVLNSQPPMWPN